MDGLIGQFLFYAFIIFFFLGLPLFLWIFRKKTTSTRILASFLLSFPFAVLSSYSSMIVLGQINYYLEQRMLNKLKPEIEFFKCYLAGKYNLDQFVDHYNKTPLAPRTAYELEINHFNRILSSPNNTIVCDDNSYNIDDRNLSQVIELFQKYPSNYNYRDQYFDFYKKLQELNRKIGKR